MAMKPRSPMHFKLRPRDPDKLMTGANTILEIDGKEVGNVKGVKFEVEARGVGTVTVTYYGSIEVDGLLESEEKS